MRKERKRMKQRRKYSIRKTTRPQTGYNARKKAVVDSERNPRTTQ